MSELKAETIVPQGTTITLQMYPKSEADKVIAELEEKRDTAEKLLNKALDCVANGKNHIISLARKNNHSNYKRCLAMARWCESKVYNIRRTPLCDMSEHEYWQYENDFWQKWEKRWLELAEKFKENV